MKLKQLTRMMDRLTWIIGAGLGFIVTWLAYSLPFINSVIRVGGIFIIVNIITCIWLGFHLASHARGWQLLVFPVCFLVAVLFFGARYTLYLPLVYLAISYLAWSMKRSQTKAGD
ncbi:hypothetical protein [uncultured Limosilactobacillus sp.]|uniref:hypothetical protein n=1 Tax=uncultured Limosilactobacillus sp. TaxID=2837629 RepID=UPI0025E04274|nr:hypothetical protein [uncultured Limosilactobacillus sp.]